MENWNRDYKETEDDKFIKIIGIYIKKVIENFKNRNLRRGGHL